MQIGDIQLLGAGTDLVGDYNGDGNVNGADYNIWRSQFGFTGVNINSDGNGDGRVDMRDYVVWRDNVPAGSGAGLGAAVPEPTSGLLLCLGMAAAGSLGRSRRTR
jgi:hypothetical protein